MSYQVLARKWRPHNFSEVVGQEHVVRALTNALEHDRLHHAYLFTGTRGVGKTTLARILSKALNCESRESFNPCGKCSACQAIDDGHFVDLIEVDAASRTKVEDTRDLLDNVQYAPSQGRFKVYLIDEVHMLSAHSFNALLKTLEEPPSHVKFLLATTDPQKIPVTVLSRCLQFNLKQLTPEQISGQMLTILDDEAVQYEEPALKVLSVAADGSMRDGLSLLDQAIVHGDGTVALETVSAMLGHVAKLPLIELVTKLSEGDGKGVLAISKQLTSFSADFSYVLKELLAMLHKLALLQVVPGSLTDDECESLAPLTEQLTREEVQLFYQIALIGQKDLPLAPDPRSGFEMVMLRMLAFRPVNADESAQRVAVPVKAMAQPNRAESRPQPQPQPQQKAIANKMVDAVEPVVASTTPKPIQKVAGNGDWFEIVKAIKVVGLTRELANNCTLKSLDDKLCLLQLAEGKAGIRSATLETKLGLALQNHFGQQLNLKIEVGTESAEETPAEVIKRQSDEKQESAEESIENDENVRALKELFDAKALLGSVKPL
jgi:DNA polymerase-3 subunit gamma/tau